MGWISLKLMMGEKVVEISYSWSRGRDHGSTQGCSPKVFAFCFVPSYCQVWGRLILFEQTLIFSIAEARHYRNKLLGRVWCFLLKQEHKYSKALKRASMIRLSQIYGKKRGCCIPEYSRKCVLIRDPKHDNTSSIMPVEINSFSYFSPCYWKKDCSPSTITCPPKIVQSQSCFYHVHSLYEYKLQSHKLLQILEKCFSIKLLQYQHDMLRRENHASLVFWRLEYILKYLQKVSVRVSWRRCIAILLIHLPQSCTSPACLQEKGERKIQPCLW